MNRYIPVFIVSCAFIVAVISYSSYREHYYAFAMEREIPSLKTPAQCKIVKINAAHIMVKTKQEAEKIRERILHGESFEKIAGEVSLCPSGKSGGNLGYIQRGEMVPEFEDAAFKLPENVVSEPINTHFGWHIIRVKEIIFETSPAD